MVPLDKSAGIGADYEFRLLTNGMMQAVHMVRLPSDAEACVRAQTYLNASLEFDSVVIRCGVRYMQKISYSSARDAE
jgi:hypothetical protein